MGLRGVIGDHGSGQDRADTIKIAYIGGPSWATTRIGAYLFSKHKPGASELFGPKCVF